MIVLAIVCFLLLTTLSGWAVLDGVLRYCDRSSERTHDQGPGEAFLLGCLLLTMLGYLVLAVLGKLTPTAFCLLGAVQAVLSIKGLAAAWRWWRRSKPKWSLAMLLPVSLATVLAIAAVQLPLLGYDAQAIYGLKAKILAYGGSVFGPDFRDPYRIHFGMNYPLLLPILESFLFRLRAIVDPSNPWSDQGFPLLFWAFWLAGISILSQEGRYWGGRTGAWAGFIWGVTPIAWRWTEGATLSGSADAILALFVVAGVSRFARGWFRRDRASLILAGGFLAGAMLTKQEGILATALAGFALSLILLQQVMRGRPRLSFGLRSPARQGLGQAGLCFVGPALAILLLGLVHAGMPQQAYMRSYGAALSWDWLRQLGDRPAVILRFAIQEFIKNQWGTAWICLALALFLKRQAPVPAAVKLIRIFVGLLLLAYHAIFLITPYPLMYHLFTAYMRLLSHAYPLAVLILVEQLSASVRPLSVSPEEQDRRSDVLRQDRELVPCVFEEQRPEQGVVVQG